MEVDLDCEVIILEVEKYPILYDKSDDNYKNRNGRVDAWKNVTEGVVGEEKFKDLDTEKLNEISREIQKKWKALRDAYLRSLRTQTAKSGSGASKRRPYPYQQQMAFLQPSVENRQTSGNMVDVEEESNALQVEDSHQAEETVRPIFRKPAGKPKKANFETQLIDILKAQQQQTPDPTPAPSDNDDNKMFLLSLLPKMRQLSPNASFDFRIKVMQYLQECYTNSQILEKSGPNMRTEPQQHSTTSSTFMNQYDSRRGTFSPGPTNSTSPASDTTSTSTIGQPWDDTDDSVLTIFNFN